MNKAPIVREKAGAKAAALEAYNRVVEHAELLDIRLTDFKFGIKPQYYDAIDQEADGKLALARAFDHDVVDVGFNPSVGALGGRFIWSLVVKRKQTKLLTVDASFFVAYKDVPDVEQEHAEAYLRKVGRFATYPYFRSLVSQMSWESAAYLPVMPVLK